MSASPKPKKPRAEDKQAQAVNTLLESVTEDHGRAIKLKLGLIAYFLDMTKLELELMRNKL